MEEYKQVEPTLMKTRDFVTLAKALDKVLKFAPSDLSISEGRIVANVRNREACVVVNLPDFIPTGFEMHLGGDLAGIKEMKHIRGGKDVWFTGDPAGTGYRFVGDHYEATLEAGPGACSAAAVLDEVEWLGVPLDNYDPKVLQRLIGKKFRNVQLAVYDGQVEQIASENAKLPFTFTKGMREKLKEKKPDLVLRSSVAFSWIGKNHKFRLGTLRSRHVLVASNEIDMSTTLKVYEVLEPLVG